MIYVKLSEWAKKQGVAYITAWRWYKAGKLPVRAEQMPSGTIIVYEDEPLLDEETVIIYARVSSHDQKEDLQRQVNRLRQYASAKGWKVAEVVQEIGSGINGRRKKLLKILADSKARTILVEHTDRLARFGVEYIEACLKAQNRKLVIVEQSGPDIDIWHDFSDVVTFMCTRIYGKQGAKNYAKRAIAAVQLKNQNKT